MPKEMTLDAPTGLLGGGRGATAAEQAAQLPGEYRENAPPPAAPVLGPFDPHEEALKAAVCAISDNCALQGTTRREDVEQIVAHYRPNFPRLNADLVLGAMYYRSRFCAGIAASNVAMARMMQSTEEHAHRGRKRPRPSEEGVENSDAEKGNEGKADDGMSGKGGSPSEAGVEDEDDASDLQMIIPDPPPENHIVVNVPRADVDGLLDFQFHHGRLYDVKFSPSDDKSFKAKFVRRHFEDAVPDGFRFHCARARIHAVNREALGMAKRGGSRNHPFVVGFEGNCRRKPRGCETTFVAGFEQGQLQRCADVHCEFVEMKMIIRGECSHEEKKEEAFVAAF